MDGPIVFDETHLFARGIRVNPRGWGKTLEAAQAAAEHLGRSMTEVAKAAQAIADAVPVVPFARHHLNTWTAPPPSVMERAIEARKNRNTGPARPSGPKAHAPRRHQ